MNKLLEPRLICECDPNSHLLQILQILKLPHSHLAVAANIKIFNIEIFASYKKHNLPQILNYWIFEYLPHQLFPPATNWTNIERKSSDKPIASGIVEKLSKETEKSWHLCQKQKETWMLALNKETFLTKSSQKMLKMWTSRVREYNCSSISGSHPIDTAEILKISKSSVGPTASSWILGIVGVTE